MQEAEIRAGSKGEEECGGFGKRDGAKETGIYGQMRFRPRHIGCAQCRPSDTIPVWRQRILPKVQRKVQPVHSRFHSDESCGTKSWSGWRKRQIKMPDSIFVNAQTLIRRLVLIFSRDGRSRPSKRVCRREGMRPLRRTQQLAQPKLRRVPPA